MEKVLAAFRDPRLSSGNGNLRFREVMSEALTIGTFQSFGFVPETMTLTKT